MEKRRNFIKKSAVMSAGALAFQASPNVSEAQARQPFARKNPSDLVEVGMVVAHGCHSYNIWAETMNPSEGKMRTTGMIITKIWSFRPEYAKRFTDKFPGVTAVKNMDDLVGAVDGVYIDAVPAVSLYHLMARPFLRAGMPTFVNRPFTTSVEKARIMIEDARKGGGPLMSNSTWEFAESVGDLQAKAEKMPRILGYAAHNSMSDYYSHGIHGVYYIAAVLRNERKKGRGKCRAASYLTPDWRTPPGALSYVHENSDGNPFYGQLHLQSGMDGNAYMRLFGDHSGDFEGKIPASPGWFRYNTWNAMQLVIQEMIEKRNAPETGDDLLEKAFMFLMGFRSVLEKNGAPVTRSEVEGWELPPVSAALKKGNQPTDSAFEEPYTPQELKDLEKYLS
ncbi:Gfo/Idh/MocA family oxidoreductase [bacterium]|nr:Gfo/Idh/MocA family oxidoreductase [bacterium]